jgi:hypothetical protein
MGSISSGILTPEVAHVAPESFTCNQIHPRKSLIQLAREAYIPYLL